MIYGFTKQSRGHLRLIARRDMAQPLNFIFRGPCKMRLT